MNGIKGKGESDLIVITQKRKQKVKKPSCRLAAPQSLRPQFVNWSHSVSQSLYLPLLSIEILNQSMIYHLSINESPSDQKKMNESLL